MRLEAIQKKLETVFLPEQAVVLAEVINEAYTDLVKTSDFNELKEIVRNLSLTMEELAQAQIETQKEVSRLNRSLQELAEAQKRTEQRVEELVEAQKRTEQRVEELAEAQKRTEQRVEELAVVQKETQKEISRLDRALQELAEAQKRTEQRVEELAEAQKRTEQRVEELAEAQKRTEQRVEELAEAQKRTEQRVEELANAQKRTEEELRKLINEHAETRRQLGGLAITVGYRLEDEAFKALPKLLKKDYGLVVKGRLKRKFVQDNQGQEIEINILGEGEKEGEVYTIVGESKSQLSKRDVDDFIRRKLKRLEGVFPRMFPVLVTYMISQPGVEEYVQEKGIALYYSYDF